MPTAEPPTPTHETPSNWLDPTAVEGLLRMAAVRHRRIADKLERLADTPESKAAQHAVWELL